MHRIVCRVQRETDRGYGYSLARAVGLLFCAGIFSYSMFYLQWGATPSAGLLRAARSGDVGGVKLMLACGADPNARENGEGTALAMACLGSSDASDVKIVRALLRAGADPLARQPNTVVEGTVLHCAASHDRPELLRVMLEAGAPPDAAGLGGWTPLHVAALFGSAGSAEVLMAAGADPDARTDPGTSTPLHIAAGYGQVNVAEVLLQTGAAVNVVDSEGYTPLDRACEAGLVRSADGLCPNAADVRRIAELLRSHGAETVDELRGDAEDGGGTTEAAASASSPSETRSPEEP
jgi:ankyrin repeat protein